jgi:hypothetical protein
MKLKKGRYLPINHIEKLAWFSQFNLKLPSIAAMIGVSPAEVSAVDKDYKAYEYVVRMAELFKLESKERTKFRDLLANGKPVNLLSQMPSLPVLPEAPPVVPAGVFRRTAMLVQRIKNHPNYNEAVGKDLGIIGPEKVIDPEKLKPVLNVRNQDDSGIVIDFKKGSMDGVEVHSGKFLKSGSAKGGADLEWTEIGRVTRSPFIDKTPNSKLEPETRYYRAIYLKNDKHTGQVSNAIKVIAEVYKGIE